MSWDCDKEKLLCHIVLSDSIAKYLSETAGPAFFRGFIVQDRASGIVSLKFRYRYEDDTRNWFSVTPKEQGPGTAEELRTGILAVLREASAAIERPLPPDSVLFFWHPDDDGDPFRTIAWLKERDLIELEAVLKKAHS